jgi:hypothetical protein
MPPAVHAGSLLIQGRSLITQLLDLKTEPYFENWNFVRDLDSSALDRKIHAAGWNFFYIAAEVKVMFWGVAAEKRIQRAIRKILIKVNPQSFNGLEVTAIVSKHWLGVPFTVVSAHSRHIQQSSSLTSAEERSASHHDAESREALRVSSAAERIYGT